MQHHHPATKLWHSAETHGTFAATLLPARPSGTLPPPLVSGVHDRNLHAMGSACCARGLPPTAHWPPSTASALCVSAGEVKAAGRQIHQQRIALVRGSLARLCVRMCHCFLSILLCGRYSVSARDTGASDVPRRDEPGSIYPGVLLDLESSLVCLVIVLLP